MCLLYSTKWLNLQHYEITKFTKTLGWPVIAEDPLSFPDAVAHASIFLASPEIRSTLIPQSVLVIGRTTLSRSINAFIKSSPITYVVDQRLATVDTDRQADRKFTELPELQGIIQSDEWIAKWAKVSERAQKLISSLDGWNEAVIARTIAGRSAVSTSKGALVWLASKTAG